MRYQDFAPERQQNCQTVRHTGKGTRIHRYTSITVEKAGRCLGCWLYLKLEHTSFLRWQEDPICQFWVTVWWLQNHDDAKKTSLDHLAWLGLHLSTSKKFQLPIFGSFSRAWERGWGHLGGLGDSLYHLAGFTAKLYGSQKLFWNCRGSVGSNSLAGDATSDLKISLMERSEHKVKQLQKCWNSNSRS